MKETITAAELRRILEGKSESILIIDVRETDEVAEAPLLPSGMRHYENMPLSVLRMLPKEELVSRLEKISRSAGMDLKNVRLIVSCRSGGRSGRAQRILADAGIMTENLEGGYLGWQKS